MKGGAVFIQPGLPQGVTGADMAIVTAVGAIVVEAAGGMALVADGNRRGEIGAVMWGGAVAPGAFVRRILTAAGAEMAGGTGNSRAATQEITAVAGGAASKIGGGSQAMKLGTVFIQPGLTDGMTAGVVTVVTVGRALTGELAQGVVTVIASGPLG